jgi:hypothetical protein
MPLYLPSKSPQLLLGYWLAFLAAIACAVAGTNRYLSDLAQPLPLQFGFGGALVFSLWYDVRKKDLRGSLIKATASTGAFALASLAAHPVRHFFLKTAAEAVQMPKVQTFLGADLTALVGNHSVGHWGSFACSLFFCRLIFRPFFIALTYRIANESAPAAKCPHCNSAR